MLHQCQAVFMSGLLLSHQPSLTTFSDGLMSLWKYSNTRSNMCCCELLYLIYVNLWCHLGVIVYVDVI